MAHKDYVARGRKQHAEPAPRPSLPWLRLVVTFGLVIGFGYFLWTIKDSAKSDPSSKALPGPMKAQQPKDALPQKPEEKWDFIETLPDYEVEVDVEEQEKTEHPYLMQCASFRSQQQAEELKAKIAFQGLESQVRASNNNSWYRVILGPYWSKRKAETDRHQLKRAGITTCQIWNWDIK